MVSTLAATDTPTNKTDALHVLSLNDDELRNLSYEQKKAIRKIYFLDDDRTVAERVLVGDL